MEFAASFNDKFRRKTRQLRHKHRRLTQILPDFLNLNLTPTKSATKLDPFCSVDYFLRYLETDLLFDASSSSQNEIPQEKVVPPINFAETLPTKSILEVFKKVQAKDLLNLRLVCKDFNRIIQDHALELPKIKNEAMIFFQTENCEIELLGNKNQTMKVEEIDRPLRHLQMQSLCLTGITITSTFIKFLHRSIKYEIEEMRFMQCQFSIKSRELAILVQPLKPKFLHFYDCKLINNTSDHQKDNENFFLDDHFFSLNSSFDFIHIDFSSQPEQRLNKTDKFSRIFSDPSKLPYGIILNNCLTNISLKTLHVAIESYQTAVKRIPPKFLPHRYVWSFGRIMESRKTIISAFTEFEELIVSRDRNDNGNNIEYIFQAGVNAPLLYLSIEFEPSKKLSKHSSRNVSRISFEEDEDENFDFPKGFMKK